MPTLLLIPTLLEISFLSDPPSTERILEGVVDWGGYELAAIGMGPIDAGVCAAHLLARGSYHRCILAGLAGSYEGRCPEAPALVEVTRVIMDDQGARSEDGVQAFETLKFPDSVRGPMELSSREDLSKAVHGLQAVTALTVSSCSATDMVARQRMETHSEVQIEEMEGYAVARACRLADVPLTCLRAVSNRSGERDKSRWHVPEAMALIQSCLETLDLPS